MRKIKNIISIGILSLCALFLANSCDLDPKFYTEPTADDFFKDKNNVYSVLGRPYTHWRWYVGNARWYLQELTTDEMVCPVRGSDWEDNGSYQRLHYHTWYPSDKYIKEAYEGTMQGISRSLEAMEDLSKVNYPSLGLTDGDKADHLNQLNSLMAYFYMKTLDFFGGTAIYYNTEEGLKPRNTDKETFEHIEKLLKDALPALKKKTTLGAFEDGYIRQAAAAAMLAQLYFNAEAYIGESRFEECAKISQDIIDGVYGAYELEDTWHAVHGFDNDKSPEIIWSIPSENAKLEWNWYYKYFYHYNAYRYFDIETAGYNGIMLAPSKDPKGNIYSNFQLGNPYEKFHDSDLRKKPYRYLGNKKYEGIFLVGEQRNPNNPSQACLGAREYNSEVIVLRDQVARFKDEEKGLVTIDQLTSTMRDGEESSGIRLVKSPQPNLADKDLRYNPDCPMIRLSEIYYMLAECKMRAGDKNSASQLINDVRKRNFENNNDPDPVTDSNLDKYRMLDEWMIEFIGEGAGRRRTDLIRWNAFVTEDWWDHEASNDKNKNRFPIPEEAFTGNPLLEQNPGY